MDESATNQANDMQAETPAPVANDTPQDDALLALTADLQRTRADFENYRKRVELEKTAAREAGASATIMKLLPVIDVIDRATAQIPADIAENKWVSGVAKVPKTLEKSLSGLRVEKIAVQPGDVFNPELHEAIQFDEESTGDAEVIAEVLQAGYTRKGVPLRHAMVKVTRQ